MWTLLGSKVLHPLSHSNERQITKIYKMYTHVHTMPQIGLNRFASWSTLGQLLFSRKSSITPPGFVNESSLFLCVSPPCFPCFPLPSVLGQRPPWTASPPSFQLPFWIPQWASHSDIPVSSQDCSSRWKWMSTHVWNVQVVRNKESGMGGGQPRRVTASCDASSWRNWTNGLILFQN